MDSAQVDSTRHADEVYAPGDAAQILEVSAATLRRMASEYEGAFEELPRNKRGDRLWPSEALERLQAARALREEGRAVSLEGALKLLANGEAEASTVLQRKNKPEPWELLLDELRALRGAIERLEAKNAALEQQIKAMQALPAADPEPNKDDDELLRRNELLRKTLEKKEEELESLRSRRWWQFWKR